MAKKKNYWLVKSEPETYSIDDLKKDKTTEWDGVRNYQARNFLNEMELGDELLFYHSNANPPGVAGVAKISKKAFPDPTQFDKKSNYYDEKASKEKPRWFCPELRFVKKLKQQVALGAMREEKALAKMALLQKGSRLSVHPVTEKEFNTIVAMGQK